MKKFKKLMPLWRLLAVIMASLVVVSGMGYGIADTWRNQVDAALGTSSYIIDTSEAEYVSEYETAEDMMNAAKAFAVREGEEGTVIMKNDNNALPLTAGATIALFGGAAYRPYMSAAGNTDQVKLENALTVAGFTIDTTVKSIYDSLLEQTKYQPNTKAGDYGNFQIKEAPASVFTTDGGAAANWTANVSAKTALVVFSRPGGEGSTYKPGSATDVNGTATGKDPLALSDDELSVVSIAKQACEKVIVLLNTSCTIEVGPLVSGANEADGIVYIGIPNDYQFTGIVNVLKGSVNATGALADTYAVSTVNSPAMMNFGGGYYSDYETVSDFDDARWPGRDIANDTAGSFGGTATYSGGFYIVEAESIYTGYQYYETRYYDSVANPSYKANSTKGSLNGNWNYGAEVSYTFGHGMSYLPYTQTITGVTVENRANGNITATIRVNNNGNKAGKFLAQLYVSVPYTQYDKTNLVEKSAIQFLNSKKVEVAAKSSESIEITVPTKYIASYDYKNAKTYILDGGNYYFTAAAGAHEAVNNVLSEKGFTTVNGMDAAGKGEVVVWNNGAETDTDTTTYAVSANGTKITNVADNADLNYYLPDTVTYLSRQDWEGTYPVNYNTVNGGNGVSIKASAKSAEWLRELRNQQYTINANGTLINPDGKDTGVKFSSEYIGYEQISNIDDDFWNTLVSGISADEAVGAVAHGGSQSDVLTNVDNPIVGQADGPNGFNRTPLSTNNAKDEAGNVITTDRYYADPESEAGQFKVAINSQTLLGSSFNPELAYEWGKILANTGLWTSKYEIWGGGLNYHRTPYNGRNTEYLSEDPMLTNISGAQLIKGSKEFGVIVGPKHMGFNDQEYDRAGICVYMTEQKMRETDMRGFQGALEDEKALGVMVAFNRIGAINVSHHVGLLKDMVRGEWGFNGLMSTDMVNNGYYFNPESSIMATITMMADFTPNDSTVSGGMTTRLADWGYITLDLVKTDAKLVEQARQNLKYQLYAFANSAVLNIKTVRITPWWETLLKTIFGVTIALTVLAGGAWIASVALNVVKEEE